MSPMQFLSILRARWKVALAVLLLTIATTLAVSLMLPKTYTGTAAVLVDVKTPDPIFGMMFQGQLISGYMATQVDIMTSDSVARRVVHELKLTDNPDVREQWQQDTGGQGDIEAWYAVAVEKYLTVAPSRESSVINVSYKAGDPKTAAAVANGFVKAYMDTTVELRNDPAKRYSTFFDSRAKELRERADAAQAKLSDYQKKNGIIGTDDRLDIETQRLNELSTQLVTLQALAAESQSRNAQVRAQSEQMAEVLNNPVIGSLKAEISRQLARMGELNNRLGDNHPQVQELKANLAELRSRLQNETSRVSGSVGVSNTVNRSREAETRTQLEAQRAKLLKLRGQRDEVAVLQRDVDSAQKAYEAVVARLNQSTLESQATATNVSVLTPAVQSNQPSSPKVLLNTLFSIVIGIALAIVAAFFMEWLDRRVRSSEDVITALDLPMLGVMPRPQARRLQSGNARGAMIPRRVLARLPSQQPRGA
jgi:succinoglycan biosynthesis transport protein ExoP